MLADHQKGKLPDGAIIVQCVIAIWEMPGKPRHFGRVKCNLLLHMEKNEKPTGEDFATTRGEWTLCELIAHFHLRL